MSVSFNRDPGQVGAGGLQVPVAEDVLGLDDAAGLLRNYAGEGMPGLARMALQVLDE